MVAPVARKEEEKFRKIGNLFLHSFLENWLPAMVLKAKGRRQGKRGSGSLLGGGVH